MKKIVIFILTIESRIILKKYKPFIIAVTGSVGKTSTKDAIFYVLKGNEKYIRKSEKSLNSEIGLPLTIIGVPTAWRSFSGWSSNISAGLKLIFKKNEYPTCLVLEIGADHPGDIRKVTKWLKPDISVITKVSKTPVHVEFFASPEEVFEEKAYLATAVKDGGTLVLFADDEKVFSLAERVKDRGVKVITFAKDTTADVRGSDYKVVYTKPCGFSFDLTIDGQKKPINIKNILGASHVYPLIAAAAVGKARNITNDKIAQSLEVYEAPKGRMNLIEGINNSMIIDDTYNSSPDAASSALDALKSFDCFGKKIAVLADMMELGKFASEEHRKIGRQAAGFVNTLVTVGPRSIALADEARTAGMPHEWVKSFASSVEAAEYVRSIVAPGDVVLVKGSQSMRMERVVKEILAEPERAGELIVRQEKEWLEKV